MNKGIVFVATGDKYVKEAENAARSVKKNMPDIPITLFSNTNSEEAAFDEVVSLKNPSFNFEDKIQGIRRSPYEKSLFLDTDTYVISELSGGFDLLKHFDVAVAHAPVRSKVELEKVPESYPDFNTGVIFFSKNDDVKEALDLWLDLYKKFTSNGISDSDQPPFRKSLYLSSLEIATLTPEYNLRYEFTQFVSSDVKIIHGRYLSPGKIASSINKRATPRVYIPGIGSIERDSLLVRSLFKLKRIINNILT